MTHRQIMVQLVAAVALLGIPKAHALTLAGVGGITCGAYTYMITQQDYRSTTEDGVFEWAQGFMSAAKIFTHESKDFSLLPADFPPDKQTAFIADYCNAHPQELVFEAIGALYGRLRDGPSN